MILGATWIIQWLLPYIGLVFDYGASWNTYIFYPGNKFLMKKICSLNSMTIYAIFDPLNNNLQMTSQLFSRQLAYSFSATTPRFIQIQVSTMSSWFLFAFLWFFKFERDDIPNKTIISPSFAIIPNLKNRAWNVTKIWM